MLLRIVISLLIRRIQNLPSLSSIGFLCRYRICSWSNTVLHYFQTPCISVLVRRMILLGLTMRFSILSGRHASDHAHITIVIFMQCCDHPYLVDSTLQGSITKGLPLSDILDAGIKASGKLQLLDMILSEIKARQLRVLILFQPIVGSAIPIGEILEDFVSQRFGQNSYERVDKHHHTKKQAAALNRFNKKESGQFVFFLEKGACVPSIKLSSVDTVVMFDSDWNAGNDLKALQKLSIDTQFPQIKVFRLYSACTSEEKALILAKQDIHLDNNLQNISCINTGTLLSWGASNLFDRLEEFHASKSRSMFVDIACEDLLANNVLREFQAILTAESGLKDPENSLIAKVWQLRGVYCTNFPLLGESKIQSAIGEEPHIFWKNLLVGRSPCLRFPCSMSRNRKRVQNFDGPSKEQEIDSDSVKKHRKVIDNGVNSSPHKEPAAGHKIRHENQSLPVPAMGSGISSPSPASSLNSHDNTYLPEGNQDQSMERFISNEQKSIHNYLTAQMEKLCEILAFEVCISMMSGPPRTYIFLIMVCVNGILSLNNYLSKYVWSEYN
ncbi:hypothetical protein Leryth_020986 [Lithospermum erythrorhizon]|nr:hypothetical protein Leryth_020986 [Lithospermum erythrorhizon]